VVEFDVADHRGPGQVVPHLRALVEVRGVVLVGLDDEVLAVGQAEGRAEVLRDAADQERRIKPRAFQEPGDDRRRRRLAVRARDSDDVPAPQQLLLDHAGGGGVGQPPLEHRLQLRIAAADRIAHDDHIGHGIEVARGEGGRVLDAELLQLRRHRRIHRRIRARDAVPLGAQQPRE
jgi:hypothetical protein